MFVMVSYKFERVHSGSPITCSFLKLHCETIASRWMRQSRIFEKEQGCFKPVNKGFRPDGPLWWSYSVATRYCPRVSNAIWSKHLPQKSQYPATFGMTVGSSLMPCLSPVGINKTFGLCTVSKGNPSCMGCCMTNIVRWISWVVSPIGIGNNIGDKLNPYMIPETSCCDWITLSCGS